MKASTMRDLRRRSRICLRWLALFVPSLVVLLATPPLVAVGQEQPATPVAAVTTAEEQLAAKYAPIAALKEQPQPCGEIGEPYAPVPVDVVLGDPAVVLRQDTGAADAASDPIVAQAPTAQDLAGRDRSTYLDLPGEPRFPGCDYERFSKERAGDQSPVVYAHIATEEGKPGIALQYWFLYVFNRFNNLHEADWEMVQLTFDAATVDAALAQEPDRVAFAQHEGGETAKWDDAKLKKDGNHPLVVPAAGSHATYYGHHVYLGWGSDGTGLGCDDSTEPTVRVPLQVQLIPDRPSPTGPFAWLTYEGRWGEKDSWPFAGPTGPNTKRSWTEPFSWQDSLRRKASLALPAQQTMGPSPTNLFCQGVDLGSKIFTLHKHYPWAAYGLGALLLLVPATLLFLMRGPLGAALGLFGRHAGSFLALGAVLAVVGTAANVVEGAVRSVPLGGTIFAVLDLIAPSQYVLRSGSTLQQFIGWTLVTPAVAFAVTEIQAGRRPRVGRAYRVALAHFVTLVKASARAAVVILPLMISVVGLPWALVKGVRWLFLAQAVVLDQQTWRNARGVSERSVIGRWWPTAVLAVVVFLVTVTVAPLVGIVVLIFVTPSVLVANTVSGVIYALLFPLLGITMTLWYQRRSERVAAVARERPVDPKTAGDIVPQGGVS